jgi:hypothetical protein
MPPKKQMMPQKQGKSCGNPPNTNGEYNVLNWRDKVKIWDVLEVGMSLEEAGWCSGKNESSVCRSALNYGPEHRFSSTVKNLTSTDANGHSIVWVCSSSNSYS